MATSPTPAPAMATAPPQPPLPPPPPPSTARRARRRAREVSSRYLSTPLPPSPRPSSSSTPSPRAHLHPSTPFADENHRPTPAAAQPPNTARKRAVMKLFDENTNTTERPHRPRPATPATTVADKISKLPRSASTGAATARKGYPRPPTPARFNSYPSSDHPWSAEEASSETSSTVTDFSDAETCSVGSAATAATLCESPPLLGPASCRGRPSSELRSSLPEATPAMGSGRASNPLCYRSLNSALSSCQPIKTSAKAFAPPRPPQPPGAKAAAVEVKKVGKKASGRPEDVHQLRLLENCYVQYRFLNAKAEAAAKAKAVAAEKSLYGLSEKIIGLRESVAEKKAQLEQIKKVQRLHAIVDAQVPYLDQWSDLEGDHSTCLSGATTALQDASLRLPITGNVRADIGEMTKVLNCAMHMLGPLSTCVKNFLPKAGEIDDVASNLAKVVVSERALIEECGNLLYQAQNLQMREYSLRSQLMQLKPNKTT